MVPRAAERPPCQPAPGGRQPRPAARQLHSSATSPVSHNKLSM